MRVYILGICGTFMAGLAKIAKEQGHEVAGCDEHVYPPMSEVLKQAGIPVDQGYDPKHLGFQPDVVIIGNALSRGNAIVEAVLEQNINYTSGPLWLAENVLRDRHVIAVTGTHGKTTTSCIITWILKQANLNPGFLIGGAPRNFTETAMAGDKPYFVIEGDEYDTAFFDKRSKFLHYRPRTLIINNLEFDHADIFPDLKAIQKQFEFLLRTVPAQGLIIHPQEKNIQEVLERGVWSEVQVVGEQGQWQARLLNQDGSEFELIYNAKVVASIKWALHGKHNVQNALAAVAAAQHVNVDLPIIVEALQTFQGVKRRFELRGEVDGIRVYDDFAHHPTAIAHTVNGLRAKVGDERIVAVLQFGSNTMSAGVFTDRIRDALESADEVVFLKPNWDVQKVLQDLSAPAQMYDDVEQIVAHLKKHLQTGDHVLIMSNKSFDNIHERLLRQLQQGK